MSQKPIYTAVVEANRRAQHEVAVTLGMDTHAVPSRVSAEGGSTEGVSAEKGGREKREPIVPFRAPRAPTPEPEAVLRFGAIEVRLSLTYLHHLRNCKGWQGDPGDFFDEADVKMNDAMQQIEQEMWREIDRGR